LIYHDIRVGGLTKIQILDELKINKIFLNSYAKLLFSSSKFITSKKVKKITLQAISVSELGFKQGANFKDLVLNANFRNLELCSLEMASHFRLQFINQPNGPYLTVASKKILKDELEPNGLYLRRYDNKLWLRGYRATTNHIWKPEDKFIFKKP